MHTKSAIIIHSTKCYTHTIKVITKLKGQWTDEEIWLILKQVVSWTPNITRSPSLSQKRFGGLL